MGVHALSDLSAAGAQLQSRHRTRRNTYLLESLIKQKTGARNPCNVRPLQRHITHVAFKSTARSGCGSNTSSALAVESVALRHRNGARSQRQRRKGAGFSQAAVASGSGSDAQAADLSDGSPAQRLRSLLSNPAIVQVSRS